MWTVNKCQSKIFTSNAQTFPKKVSITALIIPIPLLPTSPVCILVLIVSKYSITNVCYSTGEVVSSGMGILTGLIKSFGSLFGLGGVGFGR